MERSTPTLINLPPPPSDPVTPSDMGPGTPNSGTTSLSALSTTAIKDGHQGQTHPHSHHARQSSASGTTSNILDAERADRISRLAGLERVAAARTGTGQASGPGAVIANPSFNQSYFDNHIHTKEKSTVGSASATGSIGGRTTWASSSDAFDPDKMSEETDDGVSSVGGLSDEGNASLVGFGEGASSTISGPISSLQTVRVPGSNRPGSFGSPNTSRTGGLHPFLQYGHPSSSNGLLPHSPSPAGSNTPETFEDVRMMDGITYDPDVVDTTVRTPRLASQRSQSPERDATDQGSSR